MEAARRKEIEEKIISILKEKDELTFEELTMHIKENNLLLREVLAYMVRKSVILKIPNFDKGKFVYKLA